MLPIISSSMAGTSSKVLLTDMRRVLGPDHPDTLTTRNNLAYLRKLRRARMSRAGVAEVVAR